jgi:hypothetical protein
MAQFQAHPNPTKLKKHKKKFNFIKAVSSITKPIGKTLNKVVNTQLNVEKNLSKSLETNFLPILLLAGVLGGLYLIKK